MTNEEILSATELLVIRESKIWPQYNGSFFSFVVGDKIKVFKLGGGIYEDTYFSINPYTFLPSQPEN